MSRPLLIFSLLISAWLCVDSASIQTASAVCKRDWKDLCQYPCTAIGSCNICHFTAKNKKVALCDHCRKGYYRSAKQEACLPCAVGFISDGAQASQCTRCPAGQSTTKTASSQCSPTGGGAGRSCPKGSFSATYTTVWRQPAGFPSCTNCPYGFSTAAAGATSSDRCTVCAAGFGWDGARCYGCGIGFYAPDSSTKVSCKPCAKGRTTAAPLSTSASTCVPATDDLTRQIHLTFHLEGTLALLPSGAEEIARLKVFRNAFNAAIGSFGDGKVYLKGAELKSVCGGCPPKVLLDVHVAATPAAGDKYGMNLGKILIQGGQASFQTALGKALEENRFLTTDTATLCIYDPAKSACVQPAITIKA